MSIKFKALIFRRDVNQEGALEVVDQEYSLFSTILTQRLTVSFDQATDRHCGGEYFWDVQNCYTLHVNYEFQGLRDYQVTAGRLIRLAPISPQAHGYTLVLAIMPESMGALEQQLLLSSAAVAISRAYALYTPPPLRQIRPYS